MEIMIYVSLVLNAAVLVPILVLATAKSSIIDGAWGAPSPARSILMSIYFSILVVSLFLIFVPVPAFVFALLLVQVIYKATTPFTVGTLKNPVVISNLAIAAVHVVTLSLIFSAVGNQFTAYTSA